MECKDISLTHGKIVEYTYNREDKMIRSVVGDIYRHLEEFDTPIKWILRAIPNTESTEKDLIQEYIETVKDDELVFTKAGTLTYDIIDSEKISDALKLIETEKKLLIDLGFVNVIWDRMMGNCFGDPNVVIIGNNVGNNFIDNNFGEGKIINRIKRKVME